MKSKRTQEGAQASKKVCTTCLLSLPASDFYSKGNRQDSICKCCKKQKGKSTYLAKKKTSSGADIFRFIDVISTLQLKQLNLLELRMNRLINEGRKNVQESENNFGNVA